MSFTILWRGIWKSKKKMIFLVSIPVLKISSHLCKCDWNSSSENRSCNWPILELKSPIKHLYLLSLVKEMTSLSISKKQSEDTYLLSSGGKQTIPKILSSSVLTNDLLNLKQRTYLHEVYIIIRCFTTVSFTANMIPPNMTIVIVRHFFIYKVKPGIWTESTSSVSVSVNPMISSFDVKSRNLQ